MKSSIGRKGLRIKQPGAESWLDSSVRERMSIVLRKRQGRKFWDFEDLFKAARGMPVLAVTFIAMLKLSKESLLGVTQTEAHAPIYVRLTWTAT
jgi:segregation and condensation protein A